MTTGLAEEANTGRADQGTFAASVLSGPPKHGICWQVRSVTEQSCW
jgi:hypothetical protein